MKNINIYLLFLLTLPCVVNAQDSTATIRTDPFNPSKPHSIQPTENIKNLPPPNMPPENSFEATELDTHILQIKKTKKLGQKPSLRKTSNSSNLLFPSYIEDPKQHIIYITPQDQTTKKQVLQNQNLNNQNTDIDNTPVQMLIKEIPLEQSIHSLDNSPDNSNIKNTTSSPSNTVTQPVEQNSTPLQKNQEIVLAQTELTKTDNSTELHPVTIENTSNDVQDSDDKEAHRFYSVNTIQPSQKPPPIINHSFSGNDLTEEQKQIATEITLQLIKQFHFTYYPINKLNFKIYSDNSLSNSMLHTNIAVDVILIEKNHTLFTIKINEKTNEYYTNAHDPHGKFWKISN